MESQLSEIGCNGITIDTRTYDDGGRMISSTYNNGIGETRVYNDGNTLASIAFAGAPIGDLSYGWDEKKTKRVRASPARFQAEASPSAPKATTPKIV